MIHRLKHAMSGLRLGAKEDQSIRQHLLIALLVFIVGMIAGLPPLQWAVLILAIFFVIAMEFINSAIEAFANHVHPDQHHAIKKTKDLAAAGVLLASICAFLVGLVIFLPPLVEKTAECCATKLDIIP